MKSVLSLLTIFIVFGCTRSTEKPGEYPIQPVDIKNVTITDNFWLPKIDLIQKTTVKYAFDKCEKEGRMENFLIAGKQKEGKTQGKMPFDDTDLYKIIEGASLSLISKPNPELEAYLDSVIAIIKTGQEDDGYLTTWFTIDPMSPPAPWVKPSKHRWENEISSHELYNSGHLFEAAAAHYRATGKTNLLDIALKNADLLVKNFGPAKIHRPPGHQIVETGLIKLYQITQKKDYLELARYFLDLRGDSATHQLYGEYSQDHLPVTQQTEAVGHAVRAEYMYAAMTDIAAIYHDTAYRRAVQTLWENIVNHKMYLTGGVGSTHEGEAFGANDELPNLTGYNETCAAIGSVYWNHRMFMLTGDSKYYDIIERTLYNGLISGLSVDGTKFFYPNPLEADGQYPFNMGACTRQPWFDCSCCPTNLIRFIPSLPGLLYATRQDTLYANLFMSGKAEVSVNRKVVTIMQETGYPWEGKIRFLINPEKETDFTLKIRVPGWAMNKPVPGDLYRYKGSTGQKPVLLINGQSKETIPENGYLVISRKWQQGDTVDVELPMHIHIVSANENVTEDSDKVAFELGPFVYCAEEIDNPDVSEISVPEKIRLEKYSDSIAGNRVNIVSGLSSGTEFKLIPYYLWSNRGVGKMKVWLPLRGGK